MTRGICLSDVLPQYRAVLRMRDDWHPPPQDDDRLRIRNTLRNAFGFVLVSRQISAVIFDCPLTDHMDELIFDALMSSAPIEYIHVARNVENLGLFLPRLLERALPLMNCRDPHPGLSFAHGVSMTETESREMYQTIQNAGVSHRISCFVSHDEAVTMTLAQHVRDCTTLEYLCLKRLNSEEHGSDAPMSIDAAGALFDAIGSSSSLKQIVLGGPFLDKVNLDCATKMLAESLTKSNSLDYFDLLDPGASEASFSMKRLCDFLVETHACQNLHLFFRAMDGASRGSKTLGFRRFSPWKPLLSSSHQAVPLALWPHILQKAHEWNKEDSSHAPFDALFFLMWEKCDALTVNAVLHHEKRKGVVHACAVCETTVDKNTVKDNTLDYCAECKEHFCKSHNRMVNCVACKASHCRACGYTKMCKYCATPCFEDCVCGVESRPSKRMRVSFVE